MVWKLQRYKLIREYTLFSPPPLNIFLLLFFGIEKLWTYLKIKNSKEDKKKDISGKSSVNKTKFFFFY